MTEILTIPADQYHRDEVADQPTLSASIAHVLCTQSPAHARAAHPRLNPAYKREDKAHFDIGTASHAMLLEGRNAVLAIDADSWRTNAAKEARDQARAEGKIPLLVDTLAEVEEMVAAAKEQLTAIDCDPTPFTDGLPEQTIVWNDDGVLCRARVDWLRTDLVATDDYKTAADANPETWTRRPLYSHAYDLRAAFYLRGIHAVTGERPVWRWVVQEKQPPYALCVVTPGADVLAVGEAKVEYALRTWKECVETDTWPAYSTGVTRADDVPPWESRWLDNDELEAMAWAQM